MSTMTAVGTLLGLLTGVGALLLIAGLRRREVDEGRNPNRRRSAAAARARAASSGRLTRREIIVLVVTVTGGLVYGATTGFWAMGLLIPVMAVGLPRVLADPPTSSVETLDALQQWTRKLAGLIEAGYTLGPALSVSARTAPPTIAPHVQRLVVSMRSSRSTTAALYRFGDELNDPVADKVVAALIKAATVNENAVAPILTALATMVTDEVSYRQATLLAQTSPRSTASKVTLVTVAASLAFILLTNFGQAYREPLGQLVLLSLAGLYGLLLWWIKAKSTLTPVPRWLVTPTRYATRGESR